MFRTTGYGLFMLVASLALFMLKLVSQLTYRELHLFSIKEIFGSDWIDRIPIESVRHMVVAISAQHLSMVLLILGVSFVIIGCFRTHRC